jgi:hypothetical protein
LQKEMKRLITALRHAEAIKKQYEGEIQSLKDANKLLKSMQTDTNDDMKTKLTTAQDHVLKRDATIPTTP